MAEAYDAIVVGLGAMGSATSYHLARRGTRVLGLEQFVPGHTLGSSHGDSRIIRELYFENPLYVPLVQRAYELWAALEREIGEPLLHRTGGLMIGHPSSGLVHGARISGELYDIPFAVLAHEQIRARFPAFNPPADHVAVWDARAGYLRPEACNAAHLKLAARSGAVLRYEEPMIRWAAEGDGVRVTTSRGEYRAAGLVLCVGPWTKAVVAELELPLRVERQVLVWLQAPAPRAWYSADSFPVFICELETGQQVYGFPELERGVKTSIFHEGSLAETPESVARTVVPSDLAVLRELLGHVLPDLSTAGVRESVTCLFTNTPDRNFLIDFHPLHRQVLLSSPCSGHGFKFASALGEIQAGLLLDGSSRFDLRSFSLSRFSSSPPTAT